MSRAEISQPPLTLARVAAIQARGYFLKHKHAGPTNWYMGVFGLGKDLQGSKRLEEIELIPHLPKAVTVKNKRQST